jgi:hypothetical protein
VHEPSGTFWKFSNCSGQVAVQFYVVCLNDRISAGGEPPLWSLYECLVAFEGTPQVDLLPSLLDFFLS